MGLKAAQLLTSANGIESYESPSITRPPSLHCTVSSFFCLRVLTCPGSGGAMFLSSLHCKGLKRSYKV